MKRASTVLALIMTMACASVPVRDRAIVTLGQTHDLLAQAQDTERRLCNEEAFKAAPQEPILECAGPLAESIKLTTADHQRMAQAFSRAFDAELKATVALRAWRAGDPAPVSVAEMLNAAAEVAKVLRSLVPGSPVTQVLETVVAVQRDLEELTKALQEARR